MKIYIANYDIGSMTPGQESRHQHMLGRQLLQTALSREGISGDVSDENGLCALTYGPYGKPFLRELPNIQFNISHTKGLVVCAIGTASLGIDAEKIRPCPGSVLRKMIKLTGEGLAAFAAAKCVPGKPLSGMTCRQMLWQGQYVITAIEK